MMIAIRLFRFKQKTSHVFYSINFAASKKDILDKFRKMAPKHRDDPIIMKLDTPEFKSIFTDEVKSLSTIFKEYGHEIRIAGGAVRDLLMGNKPKDLDFATTATPDEMKEMFTKEGVRMINDKGEKHGTITPRINDKENFEVTTLRVDVVTDGRHAEVQYTTDWLLDANRRDLTINSMFLGLDGTVYDYFYGHDDLKAHRIAFVGNAGIRIQEDFLRILRYFRFYGRIAKSPNNHEQPTLTAIRENASGLKQISGERLWTELKKMLEGNYAGEIMNVIIDCGITPYLGFPENCNTDEFNKICSYTPAQRMHAITLMSALINTQEEAIQVHTRLKLSAFERDLMFFIVEHRQPKLHLKALHPYKQLVLKAKGKSKDTRLWVIELLKYINSQDIEEFETWEIPKFPVRGDMLKEKGVQAGRFMGVVLQELNNFWADNDFNLSADDIMKELPNVLSKLEAKRKNK